MYSRLIVAIRQHLVLMLCSFRSKFLRVCASWNSFNRSGTLDVIDVFSNRERERESRFDCFTLGCDGCD